MARINIRVLNSAKLPLKLIHGSEKERLVGSEKLSKEFYKRLKTNMPEDECSIETYQKILNKTLSPYNIVYEIEPNNNPKNLGSIGLLFKFKEQKGCLDVNIAGYKLILPMKNNKTLKDKYTILHETGHLFDKITNPKFLRTDWIKLCNNQQLYDKTLTIKDMFLHDYSTPVNTRKFKNRVKTQLKNIPNDTAIETLQNIRASLKTERQQYRIETEAMLEKPFKNFKKIYNQLVFISNYAKFNKKLKVANQLLRELIQKARSTNKNK